MGSVVVVHGLSCPEACGIFLDHGQTWVSWIGRQTLTHWTTNEVQASFIDYKSFHITLCHNLSKTLHRTQNNSQSSHDGFQAPTMELPTLLLRHLPQLCPYLPHGLAVLQTGQATPILSHCTFFSLPGKLFSCISAWLAPQPPQVFALRSPTFSRTSLTTLHKAAMQYSPEHCLLPF